MLYLAEVQRKPRVIGGGRAELRLLAYQRSEQTWSAVTGEEVISAPDDVANYNAGVLVMVELSASKQVQRLFEANRQLVSILQNFSRQQEKSKTQEEEIEQWKQSLTYQSQELNRREMEMEARQEQLQKMEEDFERLEQQRQETEAAREEVDRLRQEFERKNQELEGAWAQLRGEMSRLEERQAEMQQLAVLDDQQANQIQELLNRLAGAVAPTESVREQLNLSFEVISQQQGTFDSHWQSLEQQRISAQQIQDDVERQSQDLHNRWQEWHQRQDILEQARTELQVKQNTCSLKQKYEEVLLAQLQSQQELHRQVYQLAASSKVKIGTKVDIEALKNLPLEELKTVTQDMERDLERISRFVDSQEEELSLQQQTIDELQTRIQQASEYDRLRLEAELTDEQESYKMLNETLVGQRRNIQERQAILRQHQDLLVRRQGAGTADAQDSEIDLGPILIHMDELRQQQSEELKELREQIQQLQGSIEQAQAEVEQQSGEQEAKQSELKDLEQQRQSQKATAAELWGRVSTSQEILQPTQEGISHLKQGLEAIAHVLAQFQEASDYQLQAIAEMRQTVAQLMGR